MRSGAVAEVVAVVELRLPLGAEELLRYFERMEREYPGPHWRAGVEMCRRWLALLAGEATQIDIDQFIARLETETDGSLDGWTLACNSDTGRDLKAFWREVGAKDATRYFHPCSTFTADHTPDWEPTTSRPPPGSNLSAWHNPRPDPA
jgi:hypothetical protein